jgi:putative NIF3 family GTP cyclohydrolase 1 type 2
MSDMPGIETGQPVAEAGQPLAEPGHPLDEVVAYLDHLLGASSFDPDSNGLVVEGRSRVRRVGLAVNCSREAMRKALERDCDLLITHHAAWVSTDAYLAAAKVDELRARELGLYVAHDSLDCARGIGTADTLARAARIAVSGPFEPDGKHAFGVHGMAPGSLLEFVVRLENALGVRAEAWKNSDSFGHVGVIAGWGARPEWMAVAQGLGCDTVLSGEAIMFGKLFAREAGLNLILATHYATETPAIMALAARMARDLGLEVSFIPEEVVEQRT